MDGVASITWVIAGSSNVVNGLKRILDSEEVTSGSVGRKRLSDTRHSRSLPVFDLPSFRAIGSIRRSALRHTPVFILFREETTLGANGDHTLTPGKLEGIIVKKASE